jgi:ABC-2 type transport system ATP-binding protein
MTNEHKQTVALSVEHVSKNFHLPHEKANSIKSSIVSIFKTKDKEVDVQHALKDISFDVQVGEFFGILGRNGSGKSTMLKILAEIYTPTAGTVKTYGKLVPFIELGVGFNPELTGRENVYLNGALLGFSRKEIDARYDDIVAFAELEEFMDQKLKNYSSGMQVRLAFSVATRAEADILLVDEVLAVGDADFQRKCYDFFMSLKKQKKTVVFVTHDMGAVREYCDKAILINDGEISHSGPADKVANEYLKLFNSRQDSNSNEEENRWGNGSVEFTKVEVDVSESELTISTRILNRQNAIDGLDVGIDIFDANNHLIGGYQYIYNEPKGFSLAKGEEKRMIFKFDNHFGNKEFNATLNIKSNGGNTICDYWQQAVSFQNTYGVSQYFPIVTTPKIVEEVSNV